MKTDFIPIDYEYFDFQGKNYAKIYGRNSEMKRICVIDSCPVYFWAILKKDVKKTNIEKLIKKFSNIQLNTKGRQTKVEKIEIHEKNFLGKSVKALKIFATNYKDLHDIADKIVTPEIEKRRGYDLGFITHYIMEKKIHPLKWYEIEGEMLNNSNEFGGIDNSIEVDFCIKLKKTKPLEKTDFKPKVMAYDIETDELQIGKGEILMISLVSENFKKVITWKKIKDKEKPDYVEYVNNEKELIENFSKYVKEISPDFLVGYFSDGFDLPYIKSRAEKFRIKLNLGLDNSQPKFSRGGAGKDAVTAKISGITHIDILKFIRTAYAQYMKSETLSLNEVAKEFLGDSKKDFKLEHSSKIENKNWLNYYEYNLHDSILTFQLFEKFWPDLSEFTKVTMEPIFDLSRAGLSKYVESYILHNLNRFNEIPEKRPYNEEILKRKRSGGVEGAFVYEPKPGLYENIVMFDFTSMHTSIIISYNISKGTLLEKKDNNSFESPEVDFQGEKTRFYFSKKKGFFPELLNEIFEKRKLFKAEYKKNPDSITKARSNAFKVLSASVHGYIGFFGARYYSLESSASILAFVREFNKKTISQTEKEGYEVIYADTDSVAFLRGKKTEEQIKEFLKKLNSELPGVMELELEDFYKRGIWVTKRSGLAGAKKKYALLDKDNNLKIRGFETVRRDWCNLARKVQDKVIKSILEEGNEKKALEYVLEIIKKIKKREISKEEILIRTQLKKPISEYKAISPHVIAAKKMKELEIPISEGNLIEYYLAEPEPGKKQSKLVRDKVKLPIEEGEYNIEYYLEKQILPAVENIFQVFGLDLKEIINVKAQTSLNDF
jgi:DNA polymerase elongation subunit (family B)